MAETKPEEKKPRRRVKKVKGHGGHHGGAWKVAYADFVTAMMALFLVLWLVAQADQKQKESIASYFREPGVFDSTNGGVLPQAKTVTTQPTNLASKDDAQALFNVAKSLQKKFDTRPEFAKYKDQVKIEITDEGLRIQLIDKAERVSFPSGSAELTDEAKAILAEIARGICALPNRINIGGHTDGHIFSAGNGYTNWELSVDRANAARRALENECVKAEQIRRIVGYADTAPLVPEDHFAAANRRISITVLRMEEPRPVSDEKSSEGDKSVGTVVEKPEGQKSLSTQKNTNKSANKSVSPTETAGAHAAETKLATEGSVSIGEPDQLPDKPKVRETTPKL